MSDSYLWQSGNITNPGTMASTTKFNDGSPGDTTTGETVTNLASTNISNQITGMIDFGQTVNVTAYQSTYGSAGAVSGITSQLNTLVVEYYDGTWHSLSSDTSPTIGSGVSGFTSYKTFTNTCNVMASRIRYFLTGAFTASSPNVITTGISDARATYTDPSTCTPPVTPMLVMSWNPSNPLTGILSGS